MAINIQNLINAVVARDTTQVAGGGNDSADSATLDNLIPNINSAYDVANIVTITDDLPEATELNHGTLAYATSADQYYVSNGILGTWDTFGYPLGDSALQVEPNVFEARIYGYGRLAGPLTTDYNAIDQFSLGSETITAGHGTLIENRQMACGLTDGLSYGFVASADDGTNNTVPGRTLASAKRTVERFGFASGVTIVKYDNLFAASGAPSVPPRNDVIHPWSPTYDGTGIRSSVSDVAAAEGYVFGGNRGGDQGVIGPPDPYTNNDDIEKFPLLDKSGPVAIVSNLTAPPAGHQYSVHTGITSTSEARGYLAGGFATPYPTPATTSNDIQEFPFAATNPVSNIRNMASAKSNTTGVSSSTDGYIERDGIQKFPFATPAANATLLPSSDLPSGGYRNCGISGVDQAYFFSGRNGTESGDKLTYSNDIVTVGAVSLAGQSYVPGGSGLNKNYAVNQ